MRGGIDIVRRRPKREVRRRRNRNRAFGRRGESGGLRVSYLILGSIRPARGRGSHNEIEVRGWTVDGKQCVHIAII